MSAFVGADVRRIAVASLRRRGRSGSLLMVCAAFAVLFGVLFMHSVPMVHPPGGHVVAGPSSATHSSTPHVVAHVAKTVSEHPAAVSVGSQTALSQTVQAIGCTADCSGHSGMAMCMAVITIASALMVIRRLLPYRCGDDAGQAGVAVFSRHASRAPPWATPTLEKLSILRI